MPRRTVRGFVALGIACLSLATVPAFAYDAKLITADITRYLEVRRIMLHS